MNFSKNKQTLTIIFSAIFIVGAILFLAGFMFKKTDNQVIMAGDNLYGYRISEPLALDEIKKATESLIAWEAETEEGVTIVTVQVALTESEDQEPDAWQTATNGSQIPGIDNGANLSDNFLWIKQILESSESTVSPKLKNLTATVEGYGITEGDRTSRDFIISKQGHIVRDSRIFWETQDEGFDGVINVDVGVLIAGEWRWKEGVVNGGEIPGLEPGTNLFGTRIKVRTSFIGGPNFYPSLENIKIFIETEEI